MGDSGKNVLGGGPSKAETQVRAEPGARGTDQRLMRLQLGEPRGVGGMGETPLERQVEAGSGGDWKGFGFSSNCDGGGARREAGGCSDQDRGRWRGLGGSTRAHGGPAEREGGPEQRHTRAGRPGSPLGSSFYVPDRSHPSNSEKPYL